MSSSGDSWPEPGKPIVVAEGGSPPPLPPPVVEPPPQPSGGMPAIGWGPLLVLGGVALAAVGLVLGTIPIAIADPGLDSDAATIGAQLVLVLALIGTAVGIAVSKADDLRSALRQLGFNGLSGRDVGWTILAFVVYFAIAIGLSFILSPDQEDIVNELGAGGDSLLVTIVVGLLIVVGAPVSEEIFFRGFAFAGLSRAMPIALAAVISTAVWASLHLGGGDVAVVIQLAIFGLVLSALYARTGTLWAPILAHAINNSIAFVVLLAT